MCGRFTRHTPAKLIATLFDAVVHGGDLRPSYNVAPTQLVMAVRQRDDAREVVALKWGLIPSWAKDPKIGSRQINARGETVATKPSFRAAFKARRCLVVADGFFEWKQLSAKAKQPYYIHRQDDEPFGFAGLWEQWRDPGGGEIVDSCTIITTEANEMMTALHNRMPVILGKNEHQQWLTGKPDEAAVLLRPCPSDWLTAHPVGTGVGNVRNNSLQCIEPLPA